MSMRIQESRVKYNLRGLSNVSAGPLASPDNFGAGANRQLEQFGRAVQGFAQEGLRQDQVRRKEHDDAVSRDVTNEMHLRTQEAAKAIFSTKGKDAKNAPEEMEKHFDNFRTSVEGRFENDHQRKSFGLSLQVDF